VLAGVFLFVTVLASWARNTVFDSPTFSKRAVELLDSQAVRRELAQRLTEQLIRSGNQQAISFRPAYQLAIEAAVDTDTFRSIFRTAIRRTHQAILEGTGGSAGLDLADSVAIITSTLQLPGNAAPSNVSSGGLNNSFTDITERLGSLGVWNLDDTISSISLIAFVGMVAAAGGAIALGTDRRRIVRRLGWTVVVVGLLLVGALQALQWWVGRTISDSSLRNAVDGAVAHATQDLHTAGLWLAAYGVVIAAAASSTGRSYTPIEVGRRVRGWVERRRANTWGTVLIGVLAILIGIVFVQEPLGNLELLIILAGLWLSYLGVCELLRVVRKVAAPAGRQWRWLSPLSSSCSARSSRPAWWSRRAEPPLAPTPSARSAATARPPCATSRSTRPSSPVPTTRCRRRCIPDGCSGSRSTPSRANWTLASGLCSSTRTTACRRPPASPARRHR